MSESESEATDNTAKSAFETGNKLMLSSYGTRITQKSNINLKFQKSDEQSDAGQNTVPFFDTTNIAFDSIAPISSIGLIHYTNSDEYAGFVRPTIKSIDYDAFKYSF